MRLEDFDLASFVHERMPAARTTAARTEWTAPCPRCGGPEHLYLNIEKRCGHCFRCGWSPGLIDFVAEIEGRPRAEVAARFGRSAEPPPLAALDALRDRVLWVGARHVCTSASVPAIPFPAGYIPLDRPHEPETERAISRFRAYLRRRGVADESVRAHRIGCALMGRYAERIILPVFHDGRLVAYQARDITGRATAKYLGPAGSPLGEVLFNLAQASTHARIVLCEGILSALATGPDAVASFGKTLKPPQVAMLAAAGRPVVVLYDSAKPDSGAADAHAEADRAAEDLHRAGLPAFVARLPSGDPADHPRELVRDVVASAEPFDPLEQLHRRLA